MGRWSRGAGHGGGQRDGLEAQGDPAAGDAPHLEQVVDQVGELLHLPHDDSELPGAVLAATPKQLRGGEDGRQRVAELVAEHGEELVLGPALALRLGPGCLGRQEALVPLPLPLGQEVRRAGERLRQPVHLVHRGTRQLRPPIQGQVLRGGRCGHDPPREPPREEDCAQPGEEEGRQAQGRHLLCQGLEGVNACLEHPVEGRGGRAGALEQPVLRREAGLVCQLEHEGRAVDDHRKERAQGQRHEMGTKRRAAWRPPGTASRRVAIQARKDLGRATGRPSPRRDRELP